MSTRDFLRDVDLFRGLADAQLERLAALGAEEKVARGGTLFREKDPAAKLYAVVSGVVEIGRTKDGKFVRLARLERGEVFGEISLFEAGPHTVAALAAVVPETLLVAWDLAALRGLLESDPALANIVLRAVVVKLARRLRTMSEGMFTLLRTLDGAR